MVKRWISKWRLLSGFLAGAIAAHGGEVRVVSTVGMITDLAKTIGGDAVEVRGLIGEGMDPHVYNPTRSDVIALQKADIILYNGLHLEGRMGDLFKRMAKKGKEVHAVAEIAFAHSGMVLPDSEKGHDPHVWMDLRAWSEVAGEITQILATAVPEKAEGIRSRGEAYQRLQLKLHEWSAEAIGTIPENQRILITAHDAFQYFGKAYGLEVRGIQGISTESEAGLRHVEDLVNLIVERQIPTVFVETSVSDKQVESLIEGARARGHNLQIGGTLFSDAMGAAGTREGTYLGMLKHNVATITRALGGRIPPLPEQLSILLEGKHHG